MTGEVKPIRAQSNQKEFIKCDHVPSERSQALRNIRFNNHSNGVALIAPRKG